MATDPDADRFAIKIRDDKGDYIPLNGNQTGYLPEDEPNIVLDGVSGANRIGRMMKYFRANIPDFVSGYKVKKVIDHINGYKDMVPQNAIRIYLENGAWFAVRPSGTEPKIKFYFYAVGKDMDEAKTINDRIREEIFGTLNRVE